MKVSKRDISIVMILLGAIALFCVYQFNYRKQLEKAESLQTEIDAKKAENDELLKIDEQQLNNDITKWQTELTTMVKKYPAYYRFDDMIMYLYDLEHVEAYGAHFDTYTMVPSATIESYIGKFNEKSVAFASNDAQFVMEFTNATYQGCKQMLNAIYADRLAKNFDSITLQFDNVTGVVKGTISAHAYGVSDFGTLGQGQDTNYPPKEVVIPQVTMGVECVFGPTVTPVPTLDELLEQQQQEQQAP